MKFDINAITLHMVECFRSLVTESGTATRYSADLFSYELILTLQGKNSVDFHGKTAMDTPGVVRFLPKRMGAGNYTVRKIEPSVCIDIYFDTPCPLPRQMLTEDYSGNAALVSLFTHLRKTWRQKETGYLSLSYSLFFAILAELERGSVEGISLLRNKKIEPAITYLHEHYREPELDASLLPSLCGIGQTYFRTLFRERTGVLPFVYLRRLRVKYAAELLLTDRFTVSEIAEQSGFSNVFYFSRVFKSETGIAPSRYKEERLLLYSQE